MFVPDSSAWWGSVCPLRGGAVAVPCLVAQCLSYVGVVSGGAVPAPWWHTICPLVAQCLSPGGAVPVPWWRGAVK